MRGFTFLGLPIGSEVRSRAPKNVTELAGKQRPQ